MPRGSPTGVSKSRHYNRWRGMMRRCYYTAHKFYDNYGGRGITVCEEWHDSVTFVQWCEFTYTEGLSLDRIDSDGCYSPDNCRWATKHMQGHNRTNNNHNIGVCWDKARNKWKAQLKVNGKHVLNNRYATQELAKIAYDAAYIEHVMGGVPF